MELLLKRYFWVLQWLGIAILVAFAGRLSASVVGSRYLLDPDAAATAVATEEEDAPAAAELEDDPSTPTVNVLDARASSADASQRARSRQQMALAIVGGNIFCPTCRPVIETPQPGVVGDGSAPMGEFDGSTLADSGVQALPPGTIRSSLPLMLVATMEADDPVYSMATIADTEKGTLAPYVMDEVIREGVRVEAVQRGRVIIMNGRQLEYISIGEEPPPPPAKTVAVEEPKPDEESLAGASEAINCASENVCTVDKAFLEGLLANPASLTKQARVVPSLKDGEPQGFKFYGIKNGSLPKLLGLKNGDMLMEVNGQKLGSLDDAMGLYAKLRNASNLSVIIDRKGEVITKEIEIK